MKLYLSESDNLNRVKKEVIVQAPGRINIIGDHTDYNDGFVLPAAVDKKTVMKVSLNGTLSTVNLTALNFDEHFTFDLSEFQPLASGWQNYLMGVVSELQALGARLQGFDAVFRGDVPIGSGMSSSASLECSLAFALNQLFDLGHDRPVLAKVGQQAEHHFVGMKCGIMDQFASVMGKKDQVLLLDCRSLEYQYYPASMNPYTIVLLNSNVTHELASSEYNTRREECEESIELLKAHNPNLINLRDLSLSKLEEFKSSLPDILYHRCRHVLSENDRVLKTTTALADANFAAVGKLLYGSHHSLRNDYQVSCEEIDFLVDQTKALDYVLGSRMMGGGFGGCTISLVHQDKVEVFIDLMDQKYFECHARHITPYLVSIEDGAQEIEGDIFN